MDVTTCIYLSVQLYLYNLYTTPNKHSICGTQSLTKLSTVTKLYAHNSNDELFVGVPSAPGKVVATRNSKSSVFVQWDAPKHPNNLVGYYIDACMQGAKAWVPCNHRPYKNTRWVTGKGTCQSHSSRLKWDEKRGPKCHLSDCDIIVLS